MKLRVIGWTNYDNMRFEEGRDTFASHEAIIDDMRAHGYDFSGWHHQEADYGMPVLNDGKVRRYSQRGWGGLMADVYDVNDEPYAYARYAFSPGRHNEAVKMPTKERDIMEKIYDLAGEMLSTDEYDLLFEEDFTARYPHPELGEHEIYTLTAKEAEEVSCFEVVRQLPNCIMRRLAEENLNESFCLDGYSPVLKEDRITLEMNPHLRYIDCGDTVTFEGKSYTVTKVQQYKDVSENVRLRAMYSTMEGHDEAMEIFKKAKFLIDIFI